MKKTIKTIIATTFIAFAMFFQGVAFASTQKVITEENVIEAILWAQEDPGQFNLSEAQAEKIASIDIDKLNLSQEQLAKINMLVTEQKEVAVTEFTEYAFMAGIQGVVLIVAIVGAVVLLM